MNASNHDKIAAWLKAHVPATGVTLDDASDRTALIAVQGPDARDLMDRLDALQGRQADVAALDFYTHFLLPRPGGEWIVSRTGYTGEHGYELYLPNADALAVWEELLRQGRRPRRAAHRPGRARHAALRGLLLSVRPRAGRGRDAARGRHRLGREAEEGRRLHRPRRPGRAEGRRRAAQAHRPGDRRARPSPGRT